MNQHILLNTVLALSIPFLVQPFLVSSSSGSVVAQTAVECSNIPSDAMVYDSKGWRPSAMIVKLKLVIFNNQQEILRLNPNPPGRNPIGLMVTFAEDGVQIQFV